MQMLRNPAAAAMPALALVAWLGSPPAYAATARSADLPDARHAGMASSVAPAPSHEVRVSELLDRRVEDRSGNWLGQVRDVVIDTRDGRVAGALLWRQALWGEDQLVAVPAERIRGALERERMVLDMSPEELRGLASFPEDGTAARSEQRDGEPVRANRWAADPALRRASALIGADLRDGAGRDVGDVKDIVVDLASGRVRYGVAELAPSGGERGTRVAVPLEAVTRGPDGELAITVAGERLAATARR